VLQLLSTTAPHALIGLITFGTVVQVHELGFELCSKCYTFKGTKNPTPQKLAEQLGLTGAVGARGGPGGARAGGAAADGRAAASRFLLPIAEAEFAISNILADLRRDPWPVPSDCR